MGVYIITGGNRGIGLETARILCRSLQGSNSTVIITSRDMDLGQEAEMSLPKKGIQVVCEHLEITDPLSCAAFAWKIRNKYGGVDVLVNNSGVSLMRSSKSPAAQAEESCRVNYFGTKALTLALVPLMHPNARVVHVASILGITSFGQMNHSILKRFQNPSLTTRELDELVTEYVQAAKEGNVSDWGNSPYGISKAAVITLASVQARELKEIVGNITVCSCCPGWCRTDMGGQDAQLSAEEGAKVPSGLALEAGEEEHGMFINADGYKNFDFKLISLES